MNGFSNQNIGAQAHWKGGNGAIHPSPSFGPNQNTPSQQPPKSNFHNFGTHQSAQISDLNNAFQGFMAKGKSSKLASVSIPKTDDALIDSGATHFVFHSTKYFKDYGKIKKD